MNLEKTNAIYMALYKAMEDYLEKVKKADDLIEDKLQGQMSVDYYAIKYTEITNKAINNFIERIGEVATSDTFKEIRKEIEGQ